jgi:hypothetical protein
MIGEKDESVFVGKSASRRDYSTDDPELAP